MTFNSAFDGDRADPVAGDEPASLDSANFPATLPSPLLRNLILFGRLLRALGVPVTSGRVIEVATSLEFINIRSREDFRNVARCILVSRHDDLPIFDEAFDVFWRAWTQAREDDPLRKLVNELGRQVPRNQRNQSALKGVGKQREGNPSERGGGRSPSATSQSPDEEEKGESILTIYSATEAFRRKDFAYLNQNELADAQRFLSQMRWAITRRRSLRRRPTARGKQLDLRRSIRRSLRHGGELLDLAYRSPKLKRRQLVVLCDISGSMDRYTRLLLHFLHSVESTVQRTEVFVFGTRLTRITRELRRRDPDAAIAAAASQVQDWSGGTRIGESLRTFNQIWARRVLGHGAILVVISDGWDRGDPELLATEMARLQRASYRLLWLNPLLGSTNYRPLTQGIQAVLPYVDDFLPVHNLATLETLAELLNTIQEGRPSRKQTRRYQSSEGMNEQ